MTEDSSIGIDAANTNTSKPKTWRIELIYCLWSPNAFCTSCRWHHLWVWALQLLTELILLLIWLAETAGIIKRILKLSHSPSCASMGIGRHGKRWWRRLWKVPMICVQCLGLCMELWLFFFLFFFFFLTGEREREKKKPPFRSHVLISSAVHTEAIKGKNSSI